MPHFDSNGAHADAYDNRSMWISCRYDPDSKTMAHYDPYADLWRLYGFYDTTYADPAGVIAAAKRMVAAQCRHRYRHGGPPDQDQKAVRERYAAAIQGFHAAWQQDGRPQPVTDILRRVRLTLEQALDEVRDQRRADADRLYEQIRQGNIFATPAADQRRRQQKDAVYALSQTLGSLIRTAGLAACIHPGCLRAPVPGASDGHCLPHATTATYQTDSA